MSKEFSEWEKDNQRHDGRVNSVKDKGMKKEVMKGKVWWCGMYGEVGKTHNGVLVLSWSQCCNLTSFWKNMATLWNFGNWLWKSSQNYSKRMPSIIHGLNRMPAPAYHAITCWTGYLSMVSVCLNHFWGESYSLLK